MTKVDTSDGAEPERTLEEWDRIIAETLIERLRAHEAVHGPVLPASEAIVQRAHHTKAQQLPVMGSDNHPTGFVR